MNANPATTAPTGRKKSARSNERSAGALGHEFQNAHSHEDAKEGDWPVVTLGEVVDINPRPGDDKLADDSLASFIPMKCVEEESGRFEPLADRKVAEVRKGYTPFRNGDVIFAKVTPCMENGKAALMKGLTNGIGFGSTEFFALRPADRLDATYLLHFVLQSSFRQQAARNMTGAVGLRRVPKSYMEQQLIPLPPLPEQRRIVAEIEKQFTRLEAGVAALRRVQANLKRYRAAVLKAACEGRLVPTEAELAKTGNRKAKFETGEALLARILTEHRQNWQGRGQYKEPAASEIVGLPALPVGWCYASAEQVCSTVASGSTPLAPKMFSGRGEIPFLKVYNLTHNGALDFSVKPTFIERHTHDGLLARSRVLPHDVLMNIVGPPLGKVSFVPDSYPEWNINQAIVVFRPTQAIQNRLLTYWLLSDHVLGRLERTAKATAGQFNLQVTACRKLALPLPPLAEQTRIVAEVERRLSVVEELEAMVSANLQRSTRLRQSILQKAFTGTLISSIV